MKNHPLKPDRKVEVRHKNNEIVSTPSTGEGENIFEIIDKATKPVTDKKLLEIKKKVRMRPYMMEF